MYKIKEILPYKSESDLSEDQSISTLASESLSFESESIPRLNDQVPKRKVVVSRRRRLIIVRKKPKVEKDEKRKIFFHMSIISDKEIFHIAVSDCALARIRSGMSYKGFFVSPLMYKDFL
jgi:hypothetical protein